MAAPSDTPFPGRTRPSLLSPRRWRASWMIASGTVVALVVSGLVVLDLHRSQVSATDNYSLSVHGLELVAELQYHTQEARRTLLYALASRNRELQVRYSNESRVADTQVASCLAAWGALVDLPEEQLAYETFQADWKAYRKFRDELVTLILDGDLSAAFARDELEGIPAFALVHDDLQQFQALCRDHASRLMKRSDELYRESLVRLSGAIGAALVVAAATALLIHRGTRLRAVQASEARLRRDLEAISDELVLLDREGRVQLWNAAAERAWGRPRAEVVGRPLLEALPELARTPLPGAITDAVVNRASSLHSEFELERTDGSRSYEARVFSFQNGVTIFLHDVTARRQSQIELESLNQRLVEASRFAGMAEIATGVLHNVGNVLNSVNVSANLIVEQIRRSKTPALARGVELIEANRGQLGTFFTESPQGAQLPAFLQAVSQQLTREQASLLREVEGLQANIDHIKQIVSMQQAYAKVSGALEILTIRELVEDAIRIASSALTRHRVHVVRSFAPVPPVRVDRHKVLQILINLVNNSVQAMDQQKEDRRLDLRIHGLPDGRIAVEVADNGVGIAPENLTRIFQHGFTTKKTGHGFGLHSGANAARELGGSLTAFSAGPGRGATFQLLMPAAPEFSQSNPQTADNLVAPVHRNAA